MALTEQEQECLEWLRSLEGHYIGDEEREYIAENYPDVNFNFAYVTSTVKDGEIKTPIDDYIDGIRYAFYRD
jgi:hypothetical protein